MRPVVRLAWKGVALAALLLFVASVAYLPHANVPGAATGNAYVRLGETYWDWLVLHQTTDYPYPVHVDEAVHWARVAAIERADTLRAPGLVPAQGNALDLRGLVHERGYALGQVHFQELTGIDWLTIIRFEPAIWAAATALVLFAALRPWKGAWLAATLVALVPTSARFLGPGFFVPSGFGLAWIAAVMMLAPRVGRERGVSAILLIVVAAWAFFIHLVSGFASMLALLCALPFAGRNVRGLLILAATVALPASTLVEAFSADVQEEFARLNRLPVDFTVWDQLGIAIIASWAAGCALLFARSQTPQGRATLRAAALASVVAFCFLAYSLVLHGLPYAFYDRWHQPFVLFASVPVAYAIVSLGEGASILAGRLTRSRASNLRRVAVVALTGTFVSLIVAVPAVAGGVRSHLDEPYYRVLQDSDYARYTWARDHLDRTYRVFLDDPWKSMAFVAMTGKEPATILQPGVGPTNAADWEAFRRGNVSGAWLVERNVAIVFSHDLDVEGYAKVTDGVYALNPSQASELDAIQRAR